MIYLKDLALSRLRKKMSLNKKEFAELLGCSERSLTKYESNGGLGYLQINSLLILCNKFNLSLDYFFEYEGNEDNSRLENIEKLTKTILDMNASIEELKEELKKYKRE